MTEAVTGALYGSAPKILLLDEGRVRLNYDMIGIALSDTGGGLFHQATSHSLGGFTIEKDTFTDEQGWGVFNLQNGDKVFYTLRVPVK